MKHTVAPATACGLRKPIQQRQVVVPMCFSGSSGADTRLGEDRDSQGVGWIWDPAIASQKERSKPSSVQGRAGSCKGVAVAIGCAVNNGAHRAGRLCRYISADCAEMRNRCQASRGALRGGRRKRGHGERSVDSVAAAACQRLDEPRWTARVRWGAARASARR